MSKRFVIYADVKLDHSANHNLLGCCRHVMGEVLSAFRTGPESQITRPWQSWFFDDLRSEYLRGPQEAGRP